MGDGLPCRSALFDGFDWILHLKSLYQVQSPMELAIRARWCRHYAELNYLALRKIAKKRDRLLGGKVGEEFVQVCISFPAVPYVIEASLKRKQYRVRNIGPDHVPGLAI